MTLLLLTNTPLLSEVDLVEIRGRNLRLQMQNFREKTKGKATAAFFTNFLQNSVSADVKLVSAVATSKFAFVELKMIQSRARNQRN